MDDGITLLETVRVRHGTAPLWPLHLERLRRSARELGVPLPPWIEAPAGGDDRVVRFAASGDGLHVTTRAPGPTTPAHLITSAVPHPGYPHKTTSRSAFEAARQAAAMHRADDAVLLHIDGSVAEGTVWAIGWWQDEALIFPPLELGILPSVGRRRLEQLAPHRSGRVAIETLRGHACLLVNAARGVVPVATLDGHEVPDDPRTASLQQAFWA